MLQRCRRVQNFSLGARRRPDDTEPDRITGQKIGGDSTERGEDRCLILQQKPEFEDLERFLQQGRYFLGIVGASKHRFGASIDCGVVDVGMLFHSKPSTRTSKPRPTSKSASTRALRWPSTSS